MTKTTTITNADPDRLARETIVMQMTPREKTDLLSGFGMWKTAALDRFGIPSITMTDGTYGVRYSIPQIDGDEKGGEDLDAFLNVVAQRASDIAVAWGEMKPATCFPNGSALGNSWDTGLMRELGELLGRECRAMGVHILLGPGINIRRTPLAGRSYEYYSEDPLLTGKLSAAVIAGVQSQGVGTSLKHFACNNAEIERTTMDSLVVSCWHGIKDRPASLMAGGDLDMPESPRRKAQLLTAIESGSLPSETVGPAAQHARARDMAAQSMVLVTNEGALPVSREARRVVVVGCDAITPVIQGSGCATTIPTMVDDPLEPGECRRVTLTVNGRDLAVWHPERGRWVLEGEEARVLVGAASDDIRLEAALTLKPSVLPWRRVAYDTQPAYVLPNPHARGVIGDYLAQRCRISAEDAIRALDHCTNSFFGIFTTLKRRLRISIPEEQTVELIARINAAVDRAEAAL